MSIGHHIDIFVCCQYSLLMMTQMTANCYYCGSTELQSCTVGSGLSLLGYYPHKESPDSFLHLFTLLHYFCITWKPIENSIIKYSTLPLYHRPWGCFYCFHPCVSQSWGSSWKGYLPQFAVRTLEHCSPIPRVNTEFISLTVFVVVLSHAFNFKPISLIKNLVKNYNFEHHFVVGLVRIEN